VWVCFSYTAVLFNSPPVFEILPRNPCFCVFLGWSIAGMCALGFVTWVSFSRLCPVHLIDLRLSGRSPMAAVLRGVALVPSTGRMRASREGKSDALV
jgi:hypothetical protein